MGKTLTTILFLFLAQFGLGQYQIGLIPRISPDRATFQKIGFTEVNITYGSPALKNRQVWGDLVPYDVVWRAGANNATTVEVSSSITIQNMVLDSGRYALFIIPKEEDEWTVVFNKTHKQWGAFNYDQEEDALRVDVLPTTSEHKFENLTYSIHHEGFDFGAIVMNWGHQQIAVQFETNYLEQFELEVESRAELQSDYIKWIVYLQGAEHLLEIEANTHLAVAWINQAEKIMDSTTEWNEQFYPRDYIKGHLYWTKAKLLAYSKDYFTALAYAQRLMNLENSIYYDHTNEAKGIDLLIQTWKEK